jgi:hypothetical protein
VYVPVMARRRVSRLLHAVMALVWCGIVVARPLAMPCPTGGHGTHGPVASAPGPEAIAASAHDAHAAHAAHGPTSSATHEAPAQDAPAHSCDCLGHCCATAVVLPPVFPASDLATSTRARPAFAVDGISFVAAWTDFVLPFAIAPPVSART